MVIRNKIKTLLEHYKLHILTYWSSEHVASEIIAIFNEQLKNVVFEEYGEEPRPASFEDITFENIKFGRLGVKE